MNEIQFKITKSEIKKLSSKPLSKKQISKILNIVENDQVLWNKILESIKNAIEIILKNKSD